MFGLEGVMTGHSGSTIERNTAIVGGLLVQDSVGVTWWPRSGFTELATVAAQS